MKKFLSLIILITAVFSLSAQSTDPLDITNAHIIMWLSPDSGLYNGMGFPAANGDDIYEWHDISGNGYVFKNAINNRRPNLVSDAGHNYLDFTPGDFLQNINIKDSIDRLEEFSIFIVIKSDITGTDRGFLDSEDPDSQDDNICLRYDDMGANTGRDDCLKTGMVGNNAHHQVESQANTQTTNRQVLTLTWARGGRLFLYVDGSVSDSSDHTFNNVISNIQKILIGKGPKDGNLSGTGGWDGKIGSIIFYNHKFPHDTVHDISGALPVELVSFNAAPQGKAMSIDWVTSSEINNSFFSIERSEDGNVFYNIADIIGSGTSNSINSYTYKDDQPLTGTSYYRLKQTDFDGKSSYSQIISASYNVQGVMDIKLLANPAIPQNIGIDLHNISGEDPVIIQIIDLNGRRICSSEINSMDFLPVWIPESSVNFKPGVFIVVVSGTDWKWSSRLIVTEG